MIVRRMKFWPFLGLVSAAWSTSAAAQQLGGQSAPDISVVRVVGSLILCLLIAGLVIIFLRVKTRGQLPMSFARLVQTSPKIDVREVRRLTVHHSACLMRYQGQEYLLILSPTGSEVLSKSDVDEQPLAGDER